MQGEGSYVLSDVVGAAFRGFEPKIKGSGEPIILGTPTSIDNNIPLTTALYQNYPNPFNPMTTIKFSLIQDTHVSLNVYNYTGQLVKTLVNEHRGMGYHSVKFDAMNLTSGVYYYTLKINAKTLTKKMLDSLILKFTQM